MRALGVRLTMVVACLMCVTAASTCKSASKRMRRDGVGDEGAKQVLARIGDQTITAGDFSRRLAELSPYLRNQYRSPERRRELLENMVRFEMLALEAKKRGYNRDPEVARAETQFMIDQFLEETIDSKLRLESVSDRAIEAYYQAHSGEYHKPEQIRISHIVVAEKSAAARLLDAVNKHKNDDEYFGRMALEHSIDEATRTRGGDLTFISRPNERTGSEPRVPEAVARAAFKLTRLGDIYPQPVESTDGYHIIRLTAKREALQRSLQEVRRPIQNLLLKQRRAEMIENLLKKLRQQANIKEDLERLKDVRIDHEAI